MQSVLRDIRFGFRILLRDRSFAVVALFCLASGMGAATAIFSVASACLLRPLPYANADRLVVVESTAPSASLTMGRMSMPDFVDFKARNRSFDSFLCVMTSKTSLTAFRGPVRVEVARVAPSVPALFGFKPYLGQFFAPDADKPSNNLVLVLSYRFWRNWFNGDRSVIGRHVVSEGLGYTVIGVLPPDFVFPLGDPDVLAPLTDAPSFFSNRAARNFIFGVTAIGRLKPGVSMVQAQSEMETIAAGLAHEYPKTNHGIGALLTPIHSFMAGNLRPTILLLLAAVSLLLLITCTNVANLLLARGSVRQKEIALRSALGASPRRVLEQLLTEGLVVSIAGTVLGLVLACWSVSLLSALLPLPPFVRALEIDWRVLGFAGLASACTWILFALAPAVQLSRIDLNEALKDSSRATSRGKGAARMRRLLVAGQVALAVALLSVAGLLARSFQRLAQTDLGFDAENVLTMRVDMPYFDTTPAKAKRFVEDLKTRVLEMPNVDSVAIVSALPFGTDIYSQPFQIEGKPVIAELSAASYIVNADYFRAMRIPMLKGRTFENAEVRDYENAKAKFRGVMVINDAMARRCWPGENPVGKRILMGVKGDGRPVEVVGVVRDVPVLGLGKETPLTMYVPNTQVYTTSFAVVVRSKSNPLALTGPIRLAVQGIDPNQPVGDVRTLEEITSQSIRTPRSAAGLSALFAIVALFLTSVGVYGVTCYGISQRMYEFGMRLVLGAQPGDIVRLAAAEGIRLVCIGLVAGLLIALSCSRLLSAYLHNLSAFDPITFLGVAITLAGVALAACYAPARRVSQIQPARVLRRE